MSREGPSCLFQLLGAQGVFFPSLLVPGGTESILSNFPSSWGPGRVLPASPNLRSHGRVLLDSQSSWRLKESSSFCLSQFGEFKEGPSCLFQILVSREGPSCLSQYLGALAGSCLPLPNPRHPGKVFGVSFSFWGPGRVLPASQLLESQRGSFLPLLAFGGTESILPASPSS